MKKRTFSILAVLFLSLLPAGAVLGQSFSFGLRPENQTVGYFQYSLEPGTTMEDALLAQNTTDEDILIEVSVVAGHTALMGGVAFPGQADGPAGWIHLPDEGVVEIPAQKQVRLPFTVTVPAGTPPGEYVAGFLASPAPMQRMEDQQDSVKVNVVSQMGLTMIITVPGNQVCEITLDEIRSETSSGAWNVVVSMRNTGNIHFKGIGELALFSPETGTAQTIRDMNIGYFVAGDTMNYPLSFDQAPPPGRYEARLTLLGEDCIYQAMFLDNLAVDPDEYTFTAAESRRWDQARQVHPDPEDTAAASHLDQAGLFLIGAALFILVLAFLLYTISTIRGRLPGRAEAAEHRVGTNAGAPGTIGMRASERG